MARVRAGSRAWRRSARLWRTAGGAPRRSTAARPLPALSTPVHRLSTGCAQGWPPAVDVVRPQTVHRFRGYSTSGPHAVPRRYPHPVEKDVRSVDVPITSGSLLDPVG